MQEQTPHETTKPASQKPSSSADAEILKPSGDRMVEKPKKRHILRNFLIVVAAIVVVLIIGIAATGVYTIPGVSSVFGFNKPKDLGVKVSDEAFADLQKKIATEVSDETVDYSGDPTNIFSGKVDVDTRNTSEEITTWFSKRAGADSPITDMQVRMIEGGVEVSGMVNRYIKAPAYTKVMITRTGTTSVSLDIQEAKIGMFSIPEKYIVQAEEWFTGRFNDRMADIPGFSLEQLEFHDGYDIVKGTMPKTAKQPIGGWTDLLLEQ
ncbi:MAG: hypothetical protein PHY34_03695 [Patescibacteria group bacterium]|nr:hypothetical protein [Patescibacteria group bacterium]MDD5716005.1 hypothetical protein [Patescibacteria group bacterium]